MQRTNALSERAMNRSQHREMRAIRWQLLGPAPPAEEVERAGEIDGPVVKRVEAPRKCAEQIPEQLEGRVLKLLEPTQDEDIYRIPAGLWKRDDDYFQGDRYDPNGITGYKTVQNQEPSVDGQELGLVRDPDGQYRMVYCGRYNYDHRQDPPILSEACTAALPQHGTDKIAFITLEHGEAEDPTERVLGAQERTKGGGG